MSSPFRPKRLIRSILDGVARYRVRVSDKSEFRWTRVGFLTLLTGLLAFLLKCRNAWIFNDPRTPVAVLDGRWSYDVGDVHAFLNAIDGHRWLYALSEWSLDVLFPVAYATLIGLLLVRLYPGPSASPPNTVESWLRRALNWIRRRFQAQNLLWLPIGVALFDLAENILLGFLAIELVPVNGFWVFLACSFTTLKWVLAAVALVLVMVGFVIWRELRGVLQATRVSVLIALVAGGALFIDQGQDSLRRIAEGEAALSAAFLMMSVFVLAFYLWYAARVILRFGFESQGPLSPEGEGLFKWVPRLLGIGVLAALAVALAIAASDSRDHVLPSNGGLEARLYFMAGVSAVLTGLFAAFVIKRRFLLKSLHSHRDWKVFKYDLPHKLYVDSKMRPQVSPEIKRLVQAILALSVLLVSLFTWWPVPAGQAVGPLPILYFAASSWVFFGTLVLYFGYLWRVPMFTLVAIWTILIGVLGLNDNHAVRLSENGPAPRHSSIEAHFQEWRTDLETDAPVFIVATDGGGIRAGYWTALVLSKLQERNPDFARHLYAISSVSGGSVGAALFAGMVAHDEASAEFVGKAEAFFAHDFLGPQLGMLVAPDLLQRFLPFKVRRFDRSLGLERAWEIAWDSTMTSDSAFSGPYLGLWAQKEGTPAPALFLNGTHVETGKRIIASPMAWEPADVAASIDLIDTLQADLRLSSAVHNTARFPYVSPVGTLMGGDGKAGHIADGGYFENSGSLTAREILRSAHRACKGECKPNFHIIHISNNPQDSAEEPTGGRLGALEMLAPIETLVKTRDARRLAALADLKNEIDSLGSNGESRFLSFGLCSINQADEDVTIPLGRQLSAFTRKEIRKQIERNTPACPNLMNLDAIARVDSVLSAR